MSVAGRIIVDALFHDRDGTAAVNVVSLGKSDEISSGKVAIVTGTLQGNSQPVAIPLYPTTYRDASGTLVSFSVVSRLVMKVNSGTVTFNTGNAIVTMHDSDSVASMPVFVESANDDTITAEPDSANASYTVVLYGS
jgi:hypothetical protein